MPNGLLGEYLDTVGIELEGEGVSRQNVGDILSRKLSKYYPDGFPFSITRDASTEMIVEFIRTRNGYIAVNSHNAYFKKLIRQRDDNRQTYGYELVVSPLPLESLRPLLFRVMESLKDSGDFVTKRSATHFHVGFAHNLKLMKKLLKVCLTIDPLLFRLGGMGQVFRGDSNLAAYTRPLMNSAAVPVGRAHAVRNNNDSPGRVRQDAPPPNSTRLSTAELIEMGRQGARTGRISSGGPDRNGEEGDYVQIINPLRALDAKTVAEFWSCFGVFPDYLGLSKYHPCRYTGCNFYAIAQHGTMEFRHFNKSLDDKLVFTMAKFLRALVEMSTVLTKSELLEFPVGDSNREITVDEAESILGTLDKFMSIHEIENSPDNSDIRLLMETLEASSFRQLPDKTVRTHNGEFFIPSNLAFNLQVVTNPLKPQQVDIHTIRESSILGG